MAGIVRRAPRIVGSNDEGVRATNPASIQPIGAFLDRRLQLSRPSGAARMSARPGAEVDRDVLLHKRPASGGAPTEGRTRNALSGAAGAVEQLHSGEPARALRIQVRSSRWLHDSRAPILSRARPMAPTRREFLNLAASPAAAAISMASLDAIGAASRALAAASPEVAAEDETFWFTVQNAFPVDRSLINFN